MRGCVNINDHVMFARVHRMLLEGKGSIEANHVEAFMLLQKVRLSQID